MEPCRLLIHPCWVTDRCQRRGTETKDGTDWGCTELSRSISFIGLPHLFAQGWPEVLVFLHLSVPSRSYSEAAWQQR